MRASTDLRLKKLRELLAKLERLPESPERERMIREVRTRVVDIDTGEESRSPLTLGQSGRGAPAEEREPGVDDAAARAEGPDARLSADAEAEADATRSDGGPEASARPGAEPEPGAAQPAPESGAADAAAFGDADAVGQLSLGADDVLWLYELDDDPPENPPEAGPSVPPWARGLRG